MSARGSPEACTAGSAPKDYEAQACQAWRIRACLPHCGPLCGKGEARRKPGGWGYGWDSWNSQGRCQALLRDYDRAGILPCSTRRKERTLRIVSLWPLTELFHLCREVCTWCQTKSVKTRDAAKTRDRMALGSKCIVYLDNEYAVFSQIMGKCHAN